MPGMSDANSDVESRAAPKGVSGGVGSEPLDDVRMACTDNTTGVESGIALCNYTMKMCHWVSCIGVVTPLFFKFTRK